MAPAFSRIGKLLAAWKWVLGYTALLLLTLSVTRRFLDWLALRNLSGLPSVFLLLAGVGCLLLLLRRIHRLQGGFSFAVLLRLLGFVGLYLGSMFTLTRLTVDRIHFVEYGILGLLCFQAVGSGHRAARRVGYAMVAVMAVAFLDESVQGILAGRYFDVRDLVIDLVAGLLPVLVLLGFPSPAREERGGVEAPPVPEAQKVEGAFRSFRAADVSALALAVLLVLAVLWVDNVSWDLEPLWGIWVRQNPCGRTERIRIGRDGGVLWEDDGGGIAKGTYRVGGNRLDGPLLEIRVLEAKGSGPCSWTTGEVRPRYFRVEADRLVFTKEKPFPFSRAGP